MNANGKNGKEKKIQVSLTEAEWKKFNEIVNAAECFLMDCYLMKINSGRQSGGVEYVRDSLVEITDKIFDQVENSVEEKEVI